jgi:hypothetical protein
MTTSALKAIAAATTVAVAHAMAGPLLTSAAHRPGVSTPAPATAAVAAVPADPKVTKVPPVLTLGADPAPAATIVGEHFDKTLTLTLRNTYYVVTIGANALRSITPTSLQFDPSGLDDGVYGLSVRNLTGRASNEIFLTVKRK